MNIGKKQKELRIVVFIFYFLLSLLSFVAIIAIGLGVMMVFWQLNFGQELPTEYIDNLEMPSYIFIAIGVYLTMRKFTLKSTVFDHSYRDIRKYIEYIKKAIIYPSLVIFSRMKLTIIYFVYFLLLLLASFLINQIWVSFYKERSIANLFVLYIPSIIVRRFKNIRLKRASAIVILVITLFIVLYYTIGASSKPKVQEKIYPNIQAPVNNEPTIAQFQIIETAIPTQPPTPTIDPDPVINCRVVSECGGGVKQLKATECSNSVCCQIGTVWTFYYDRNKCLADQESHYNELIKLLKIYPSLNIPTLAPLPTMQPLQRYTPNYQNTPLVMPSVDMYQMYKQCVKNATDSFNARVAPLLANGAAESSLMIEAQIKKDQDIGTCQKLYRY